MRGFYSEGVIMNYAQRYSNEMDFVYQKLAQRDRENMSEFDKVMNPVRFRIGYFDQLKRFGIDYCHVGCGFDSETHRQHGEKIGLKGLVDWAKQFKTTGGGPQYYRPVEYFMRS